MIIGTAGHVDHGKTALVRALTGVDADRLPEEKARGMTIDLGFAYRSGPGGEPIGFVDVPGHERFVHTMVAGATGIDFVLLVVAADDGPMPQTREHMQILDLLGLGRGLVALTKADLAPPERLAEVATQIRALLAGTMLAEADIVPVSAVTGQGIAALEARLLAAAAALPRRTAPGHFRLAVDRSFTLAGAGTVVTGTAFAGEVAVGDRLCLIPAGIAARVRSLHVQNRPAERGRAGQRCALALAGSGIDKDRIRRGDWLAAEALHRPTDRIDVRLRLLDSEPRPLRHWTPAHLHLGAAHVPARVALLEGEVLAPGGTGLAQLVLDRPIGALHGDRLILRDQSAIRTIGGGAVLDPWPPARGRRRAPRLAVVRALDQETPEAALAQLTALDPGWVDLALFALAWNLDGNRAGATWHAAGLIVIEAAGQTIGLATERWAALTRSVQEILAAYHAAAPERLGLEPERLRLALSIQVPPAFWAAFVAALLRDKAIESEGAWLRLPGHAVRLSPDDERLWAQIEPLMTAGRFQPPRVRDYANLLSAPEHGVRQLLRRLARMGRLVQVAPDHFYARSTVAELCAILDRVAGQTPCGDVTAAEFRDAIGTGRKVAIQILEFFDRAGITVRRGDRRAVEHHHLDRFDPVGSRSTMMAEESVPGGAAGLQTR